MSRRLTAALLLASAFSVSADHLDRAASVELIFILALRITLVAQDLRKEGCSM